MGYSSDNIEVGRHETMPLSRPRPFFFMINLATGRGWPVDLSRYDGRVDRYVDYVRCTAARRYGLEPGNLAGRARTGDVFTGGSKRAAEDGLATTRDLAHACA